MSNSQTIVAPKETTYFVIVLVLAILGWLAVTAMTVGFVWIFIGIMALVVWFSNGLLVAGLRAEAVEVNPKQMGRLDATFRDVCAKLGVREVPELYVLQSGGLLNAFATRHTGRHFVVVYSDMLESFGPDSAEMRFLLGHEIGHIQQNHLLKRMPLAPGLFMPLIGPAYSRSCETTCDRFGAAAAGDVTAALRAMMILAGGKEAGREMDPMHFAEQNNARRGFFVSWYELISGYPTLSRRVNDLRTLSGGHPQPAPSRNPISYLFALCTFGGGFGGRGNILSTIIFIYFVAIFAAMMIPAFSGAMEKAREMEERREATPSDQPVQ